MTLTLSDCMERINQALDYPAVEYSDISHFFDQAIAELNSALRIGIKPISYILKHYVPNILKESNAISISEAESKSSIPAYTANTLPNDCKYYFDTERKQFGLKRDSDFTYYNKIYGYISDYSVKARTFASTYYTSEMILWTEYNTDPLLSIDLTNWLPVDVIILFIIPYVCHKFRLREGGEGNIFREEFVQGFQQIQTSYDIPNTVPLISVAGKTAYIEDVETNINNFNIEVPVRAIYDSMKIGNAVKPVYGGFYESGGWGF